MIVDLLFLAIAAYGYYVGYNRGIIKTVFSIISIVVGLLMALRFTSFVHGLIQSLFNTNNLLTFLCSLLLTFFAVMLVIRLGARFIERGLEAIKLNILNKVLGGFLIAAFFLLIFSTVLWFIDRAGVVREETKQHSITMPYLLAFPIQMKGVFQDLRQLVNTAWQDGLESTKKQAPAKE